VAGADVVTDDVLRVEVHDGAGYCFTGSPELRLRSGVAGIAEHLVATRHSTIDERLAVQPAAASVGMLPLSAFVAPRYAPGSDELTVERLHGSAALRELLRAPRTVGWVGAERAQHDLGVLAALVESVAVYSAEVPARQPLDPELGRQLLERIDMYQAAAAGGRSAAATLERRHAG
jgi:hypothetical protein